MLCEINGMKLGGLGCAMFWSLRYFNEDAEEEEFALRDLIEVNPASCHGDWDSMEAIHQLLEKNSELRSVTRDKVGQVLQVATLRIRDSKGKAERLVVGNTHLFYHPMADHIRAIQAYTICRQMDEIRRRNNQSTRSSPYPLLLCGDLNSDPLSGAVSLLLHRQVKADHFETWKNLNEYSWDKGEQGFLIEHGFVGNEPGSTKDPAYVDESFRDACEDLTDSDIDWPSRPPDIRLPRCFPNLTSGYPEMPEFTNYAVDFAETLDYILVSEAAPGEEFGFEVCDSAPLPSTSIMQKYVAMPNEYMPSDHVSILCDLKWKRHRD